MVQLNYGDRLRFSCSFQHRGVAYTGAKLHAAIGHGKGLIFDEILNNEITISGIIYDAAWQRYTVTIDIKITSAIAGGSYEAYVKLMSIPGSDIFWYSPLDAILIGGVVEKAEFENLSVSYQKV